VSSILVVTARCSHHPLDLFRIKLERISSNAWQATWAFALQQPRDEAAGSDRSAARGEIGLAEDYPGCPSCSDMGLMICGHCSKPSCWDGESRTHCCPWCRVEQPLEGPIEELRGDLDG
jgi:hypothetical protein